MRNQSVSLTALVEAELMASGAWLITIRWLAGLGVVLGTFVTHTILNVRLPVVPLYIIGVAILIYNACFRAILARLARAATPAPQAFAYLANAQIGLDWSAMIALIHFSGGLESPAVLYFFFHIIIAAILLSPRATYFWAAMATLLLTIISLLEFAGILPHEHVRDYIGIELYTNPVYVLGRLVFFISTMFVAAYLASTLSSRLRKRETQVVTLSQNLLTAYTRLQTVYESAEAVNSTLELGEVLDRLVRRAADALKVRACSIRLLDETGARLSVAASYGLSDAYTQKGDLLLEHNPLARQVIAGKTIVIGDVTNDARLQYPHEATAEGIRAMLSAPLTGKKGALGLIRAYSVDAQHFTPDDAAFLEAIARVGSIAIENALAYRALGKLDQMKSKFVLTVTHELRSPVSVVRSLMRTILAGYAGDLNTQQREMLTRVQYRADFLQTLIDDLLDLAAGKADLAQREDRVIVRLDEAIARIVERFKIPADEKRLAFEWRCEQCPERTLTISATGEGMDRILNNLISNAIKYTPNGGRVTVHLRADNATAMIEIADSGIGIPPDALPHLFEEFYRAPNAKAQIKEGTGLGLAITKDLVTRYGGHIAVQSQPGQGTIFTLTFPLVTELPM